MSTLASDVPQARPTTHPRQGQRLNRSDTRNRTTTGKRGQRRTKSPFPPGTDLCGLSGAEGDRSNATLKVGVTRPIVWLRSALELAQCLHQALASGRHGEDLRPLFADDAVTIENPNLPRPRGARMQLEEMLAWLLGRRRAAAATVQPVRPCGPTPPGARGGEAQIRRGSEH